MDVCQAAHNQKRRSRISGPAFLLLMLVFLVPSGCATERGTSVAPMSLARIQVGKSSMNDVRQRLGPPDRVKERFGEPIWIYSHQVTKGWIFSHTTGKTVAITFSSSGMVKGVKIRSTETSEEF